MNLSVCVCGFRSLLEGKKNIYHLRSPAITLIDTIVGHFRTVIFMGFKVRKVTEKKKMRNEWGEAKKKEKKKKRANMISISFGFVCYSLFALIMFCVHNWCKKSLWKRHDGARQTYFTRFQSIEIDACYLCLMHHLFGCNWITFFSPLIHGWLLYCLLVESREFSPREKIFSDAIYSFGEKCKMKQNELIVLGKFRPIICGQNP